MELTDLTALDETSWFLVHFNSNEETQAICKSHYVHKCLLSSLITDMQIRGHSLCSIEPVEEFCIDLGGAIIMGMPIETIRLDLVNIDLWSHQILGITNLILSYSDNPRQFVNGQKYYKLHHWGFCTVFTADQHDALIEALLEMLPDAEERSDEFIDSMAKKIDKD